MYRKIWEFFIKKVKKESVIGVYLSALIVGWTGFAVLAGILFCAGMRLEIVNNLANIFCVGAYAGIIFGLFGGILFLHRFLTNDF